MHQRNFCTPEQAACAQQATLMWQRTLATLTPPDILSGHAIIAQGSGRNQANGNVFERWK